MLASTAAVAGFLAFNRFVSPQYVVWLIPLVLLLPGWSWLVATGLVAASLVLAQIWFFHYSRVFELERITWLVVSRDALLLALYVLLVFRLKTSTPSSEKTSRHSGLRRSRARSRRRGQRIPAVGVAGPGLVRGDPVRVLDVREAQEPAARREV